MLKILIIYVASLPLEISPKEITGTEMKVYYDIDDFKDETQICFITDPQHTRKESGFSNFMDFIRNTNIWVDKSLLAAAVMKTNDAVLLITTPRKWGKSLNLNMLKVMFERNFNFSNPEQKINDVNRFFKKGEVWSEGEGAKISEADKIPLISKDENFMNNFFQKFPVVYLNFALLKPNTWRMMFKDEVGEQYLAHAYLMNIMENIVNDKKTLRQERNQAERDLIIFEKYSKTQYDDDGNLCKSIKTLCQMLYYYVGKKCIIFIDEFDAIQNDAIFGQRKEYDEEKNGVDFMRSFIHATFKDKSPSIEKAILTGIMRAAKATLLSGMNNVLEYNDLNLVKMLQFTPFYGFTPHEVKTLLCKEEQPCDNYEKAVQWYDGYRSLNVLEGSTFNPWSLMRFTYTQKPKSYWENTASKNTIEHLLQYDFFENTIHYLLFTDEGYKIPTESLHTINHGMLIQLYSIMTTREDPLLYEYKTIAPIINCVSDAAMAFMCQAGYLTVGREVEEDAELPDGTVKLFLPNFELRYEMKKLYISSLKKRTSLNAAKYENVLTNCTESFAKWFLCDITSEQDCNKPSMNETFQKLRSHMEELFDNAGKFQDLTLSQYQDKAGKILLNYQHTSEATVRRTLAPVLENFRLATGSTFMEEWGSEKFGKLDTQIFFEDKCVIIEYKCDSNKNIEDVLDQAKNYTRLIMSKPRVYKWIKFLAINVYKKESKAKHTVEIAHYEMTWKEAENFVKSRFQTTIEELRRIKSCAICNKTNHNNDVGKRHGVSDICASCNIFCKTAIMEKATFKTCLTQTDKCHLQHDGTPRKQGFCQKCRLNKCKEVGFSEEKFV